MLTRHGPWSYHVRVKNTTVSQEIDEWLTEQNKLHGRDYEIVMEAISHPNSPKLQATRFTGMRAVPVTYEPIFFFNDLSLTSYVKLTWGGR